MLKVKPQVAAPPLKAVTGIPGLDAIVHGGFPRSGITLVEGGPGAGKTILALQFVAHGARQLHEPGIFVAFEEVSSRILANAACFSWGGPALVTKNLFFLDAQPQFDLVQSGRFDLGGLLAALDAKIAQMKTRRIVFDAMDVVLSLLNDPAAVRRELYRLRDWIAARDLAAIFTAKSGSDGSGFAYNDFMQFMAECAVTLEHTLVEGVSQRSLHVRKFRGSDFQENAAPFVIDAAGLDVAVVAGPERSRRVSGSERVTSGIDRLDTMLGGGYFRGAGILVTGAPGTAKTTLCGAFAEAACKRGEATLFVSFDSVTWEVARNLSSVNMHLNRYLGKGKRPGLLKMVYSRALEGSAETHLLRICAMARAHKARCVVIDPVSALGKSGNRDTAQSVARRLMGWAKSEGITLFCTSLIDEGALAAEGSPLQISTIADTWIHLSYNVRGGERNRALTIIKSRGTAHSNQVRELLLSHEGVTLADVYMLDGEVLMGTLRWEREQAAERARQTAEREDNSEQLRLMSEEAAITGQVVALQRQLQVKQAELQSLEEAVARRRAAVEHGQAARLLQRAGDADRAARKQGAPRTRP